VVEALNINKAIANPSGVFGHPDKVVECDALTDSQKRDILLRWRAEAIHMQESEAEGFGGGERSRIDDIICAIEKLA
jgi:hypothetical protein